MALSQGRGLDDRTRRLPQCGHSGNPSCRQYSRSSVSRLMPGMFKPRRTVEDCRLYSHTAPAARTAPLKPEGELLRSGLPF